MVHQLHIAHSSDNSYGYMHVWVCIELMSECYAKGHSIGPIQTVTYYQKTMNINNAVTPSYAIFSK